jgi:hypothetical protein
VASDLGTINGHGRTFRSLKFRCRDCDIVDCEVVPFEDDPDRVHKKRTVWRLTMPPLNEISVLAFHIFRPATISRLPRSFCNIE